MIRSLAVSAALAGLMVGCSPAPAPAPQQAAAPSRAGEPLDQLEMAGRIAKARAAAVLGDEAAVQREMDAMQDDVRRSVKLPDGARPIDQESARAAAKRVPGVHSAVWVDRHNLLALVNRNDQRSMDTIDAVCRELEPLGDTLAVVVHLQSRAAHTGDELETINRNCQLAEDDRALFQAKRELDVIPKDVRAEHAANRMEAERARESQRQADGAMRLLEATTPEM
jgi:hypothetical protein